MIVEAGTLSKVTNLKVKCYNCDMKLEVATYTISRGCEVTIIVVPCEACVQEAIENYLPDEDEARSPFCDV